jgi:glycine cleavage system H protein
MLNIRSIKFFMLRLAKRLLSTRRFTADHEWVSVSDGIATMGITDYAQKALGDVVYIEVPQVGQQVQQKGLMI